ncbi:MAG: efflux RND transporter periplasmic adaptor subunit [Steroidobacteraceae bacterium]
MNSPFQMPRLSGLAAACVALLGACSDPGEAIQVVAQDATRGVTGGAAAVAVVVQPAERRQINDRIEAVGTARANEAVDVTAKATNIVAAVHFSDGERVRAGQVLVELDSAQARADLAEVSAALTESSAQYNRSKDLVAAQVLSRSAFDQLEATMKADEARLAAARAKLEDTVIKAPFNGRAGLRRISVGSLISPGTVITTIDDTSIIKLDFAVPERYLAVLREGDDLSATSSAWPGRQFDGKVASIDSRVDASTRALTVRARLPNPDGALRAGMFLTVQLPGRSRSSVVIPEQAVVPEQARQFVYVIDAGVARKREVQLGSREPGSVEVVNGLAAGEQLVVDGTLRLSDGAAVQLSGT